MIKDDDFMFRKQIINDFSTQINTISSLVFGNVEDDIELAASFYLPDSKNRELSKVIANDLDWFLQKDVNVLEMRNHKLFILNCFTL